MASPDFLLELRRRINRGIDVAIQTGLRAGQGICHSGEGDVAHHENIHVAIAAQLAACRGAEHECRTNSVGQRRKGLTNDIDDPGRLQQEHAELREYRALTIRLEVDVLSLYCAPQDPCLGELLELTLHGPLGGSGLAHDLSEIEPLVGVTE